VHHNITFARMRRNASLGLFKFSGYYRSFSAQTDSTKAGLGELTAAVKDPVFDQQDLLFHLFDVLKIQNTLFTASYPRFSAHSPEFVKDALASAGAIATNDFAPHNRKNDLNEPKFDGKCVTMIPEVKHALAKFYEAGLGAAHADEAFGGMQLPSCVTNALMVPFYSANIGTITYPFLTIAAGNMLRKYGTASQLERFLKPMLDGRFTGTMNLSETQAGSSLGDITTRAYRRTGENGKYSIRGAKM
jgi:alkylation response protein AidB-like acyl-CoA dehydrogenase